MKSHKISRNSGVNSNKHLKILSLVLLAMLLTFLTWHCNQRQRASVPASPAANLYAEVRVFCLILTQESHHKQIAYTAKHTWTQRCDRVLFASNAEDEELQAVMLNLPAKNMSHWQHVRKSLRYAFTYHFDEADWFLIALDSTFVVVENLRYLLKSYSPDEAIFFGCKLKNELNKTYMYGQAGYVLSREALRRYVTMALPNATICQPDDGANADERTSECLQNVGVVAGDSRDADGRESFIPFNAVEYAGTVKADNWEWYSNRSFYFAGNYSKGLLSPHAISFSHTYAPHVRDLYYFIYKLRKFGRKRAKAILPVQSRLP